MELCRHCASFRARQHVRVLRSAARGLPEVEDAAERYVKILRPSVERLDRLEVRADIEEGLADVKAGRVVSTAELRREFGLPE